MNLQKKQQAKGLFCGNNKRHFFPTATGPKMIRSEIVSFLEWVISNLYSRITSCVGFGFAVVWATAASALAQNIAAVQIADGLNQPIFITAPPGDTDRLFVLERSSAQVKVINKNIGTVNTTPFVTVAPSSGITSIQAWSLAFHPDFNTPNSPGQGKFYVNYTGTDAAGLNHSIMQYQVDPASPDAVTSPGTLLARFSLVSANSNGGHRGGSMGFSPNDGLLYLTTGDAGNFQSHDAPGNAQDITDNKMGKILRIDVNSDDFPNDPNHNYAIPASNPFVGTIGDDEIWAYGLRNPFKASFDRDSGDLYIGDVGQDTWEEVNFQSAASAGGLNYGWSLREGDQATPTGPPGLSAVGGSLPNATDPILQYGGHPGRSITGGYVYRGPIQPLQAQYFFADAVTNQFWSTQFTGSGLVEFDGTDISATNINDWTQAFNPGKALGLGISSVVSWGEDAQGNLFFVDHFGGKVFQITHEPHWQSSVSGDWDNNANWTFNVPPIFVHNVIIDPATSLVVTGPSQNTTVKSLTIGTQNIGTTELHLQTGVTVTATDGITIAQNARLSGSGQINGNLTQNSGTVAPGNSPGVITINGSYSITSNTAIVEVDIAGTDNSDPVNPQFDQVTVTNNVSLDGTLELVVDTATFTPAYGNTFTILTYGTRTGTFDQVTLNGSILTLQTDLALAPVYDFPGSTDALFADTPFAAAPDSLTLFTTLPGDANLDLQVEDADLSLLLTNFGNTGAAWTEGDFTGDGIVDDADLSLLLTNFGGDVRSLFSSTGLSTNAATIPEPATVWLMSLGCMLLGHRRAAV